MIQGCVAKGFQVGVSHREKKQISKGCRAHKKQLRSKRIHPASCGACLFKGICAKKRPAIQRPARAQIYRGPVTTR